MVIWEVEMIICDVCVYYDVRFSDWYVLMILIWFIFDDEVWIMIWFCCKMNMLLKIIICFGVRWFKWFSIFKYYDVN